MVISSANAKNRLNEQGSGKTRDSFRLEHSIPIELKLDLSNEQSRMTPFKTYGHVKNISNTGMLLFTNEPPVEGTSILIKAELDQVELILAKVMRVKQTAEGYEAGVEFNLVDGQHDRIAKFIQPKHIEVVKKHKNAERESIAQQQHAARIEQIREQRKREAEGTKNNQQPENEAIVLGIPQKSKQKPKRMFKFLDKYRNVAQT